MENKVNTPLAIAAAMAVSAQKMPEHARSMAMGLSHRPQQPWKPNRKQRRQMVHQIGHGKPVLAAPQVKIPPAARLVPKRCKLHGKDHSKCDDVCRMMSL